LNGVSFTVDPGEFVAIVGSTGSGKSTILRLLLGFESPDSGSVFYDGHELDHLDVTDVRRQCGVVLQGGSLLPGDILTNITGGIGHSVEDAWNAARLAGIADDIKAMPMNMYTYIAEGASTFSGGQAQRLMIARALVSSPRILYFDEATSALDNETQRLVTESTHKLNASRVVIAHRLSTIALADKIVVLDGGRIVQQGTYAGLLADTDGVFARLVGRQLLEEQGAAAETADPESYTLDDLSILAARSEIVDPPDGA
jgi:ABC-type bacteriocin/lantibiotic exporter with double-glycine peptidase domain